MGILETFGLMWKAECTAESTNEAELAKLTAKYMKEKSELVKQADDLLKKWNETKAQNENLTKNRDELFALSESLDDQNNDLTVQVAELKSLIATIPAEAKIEIDPPNFMDADPTKAYQPYVQWNGGGVRIDPRAIYVSNYYLKSWMAEEAKKLGLPFGTKYEKTMMIWHLVVNAREYVSDNGDNHQFGPVTIARKKGDCEDGAELYVSLAMMLGLFPSEVFNDVGDTSFGYHSYPIVNFADGELPDGIGLPGWYIFETTLSSGTVLVKPKKLVGSNYWTDSIANWQWAGIPLSEYWGRFNGQQTGAKMDGKKGKVNNSKKKQAEIQKAWEKDGNAR